MPELARLSRLRTQLRRTSAPHHQRHRQIEPRHCLGVLEDEVAELIECSCRRRPSRRPSRRGRDAAVQLLRPAALPVRAVLERVDLDVTRVQQLGEPRTKACLSAAARADDATMRVTERNSPRATITAEPPTSTSSGERATRVQRRGRPISTPCTISISSPKPIRPCRARWSASGPAAEPVAGSSLDAVRRDEDARLPARRRRGRSSRAVRQELEQRRKSGRSAATASGDSSST